MQERMCMSTHYSALDGLFRQGRFHFYDNLQCIGPVDMREKNNIKFAAHSSDRNTL